MDINLNTAHRKKRTCLLLLLLIGLSMEGNFGCVHTKKQQNQLANPSVPKASVLKKTTQSNDSKNIKPTPPIKFSESAERGRILFTTINPSCSQCHILANAGSKGIIGPNLDQLVLTLKEIETTVTNGMGIMPSFKKVLTVQQIRDVSTYIFEATRH